VTGNESSTQAHFIMVHSIAYAVSHVGFPWIPQ